MLVLSRKSGQSIKIGDDITVVVQRIAGSRVTIALEAPRQMRIIRGELRPFDDVATDEMAAVEAPVSIHVDPADVSTDVPRLRQTAH